MYTYSAAITMGAVHHHLINKKLRMSAAVVVETGEARYVYVYQRCKSSQNCGYGIDGNLSSQYVKS